MSHLSRRKVDDRIKTLEEGLYVANFAERISHFFVGVRQHVIAQICSLGLVSVAVDGWEDYSKHPTLAFTVHVPQGRAFLFKFVRVFDRENGEFLDKEVRKVVDELNGLGVKVSSVIADNAYNIQKGLRLGANAMGFVPANCWAHTLNLMLEVCSYPAPRPGFFDFLC